jgi:NADH:ubiquinone oxidoreductase subunit 2 (chain N)
MSTLITVSGLGILCLLLEVMNLRKVLIPVVLIVLFAILGMTWIETYSQKFLFTDPWNMIADTAYSCKFSMLFILLTIFLVTMSRWFYENQSTKITDYIAIKIFLLAGAIAMVSFGNLAMFFLGLEVLSIAGYILASSNPRDRKSNEAGIKYFIMGAFASSFTLLGITLVYGAVGSFTIEAISSYASGSESVLFSAGMTLMAIGLFFKASIVPFHFWAPDVYEGSPAIVTAMMSTLVRVASVAALYKMFVIFAPAVSSHFQWVLVVLSILTMTIGNITALRQRNIKRMMAYSSISHTGFMMMALLALHTSSNTIFYYAAAYSLANVAAFSVILAVCRDKKDESVSHFSGLFHRKPVLAFLFPALCCHWEACRFLPVFLLSSWYLNRRLIF